LAADPTERRRLGAAARRKALEDFDQRRCIDITLATYDRLLTRAGVAVPTTASTPVVEAVVEPAVEPAVGP
jgi:hypothetical protein